MSFTTKTLTIAAAAAFLSTPALAGNDHPLDHADGTMMSLSGLVTGTNDEGFVLDYGSGKISVDMDDFDADRMKAKSLDGEMVTVFGEIDDDFFERTELEAMSIYLNNQYTYIHGGPDDTLISHTWSAPERVMKNSIQVRGVVTSVADDDFMLNTGSKLLKVDVDDLGYDPLDKDGWQQVGVGDVVSVRGKLDKDLFSKRELEASSVVTVWEQI